MWKTGTRQETDAPCDISRSPCMMREYRGAIMVDPCQHRKKADRAMHKTAMLPFLALLFLFWPIGTATAFTPIDAAALFGTTHGDGFSSLFLNQIFGPIFPSVSGGASATVFSVIIGYFNVIILVIGGILFFYNATVGLLQSAHEGQVLGQRWSSLWAPLRVLFAVGLLVPVPGLGGYNLVQSGVAYVVKGSTNIASAVWSTSAELVITGRVPISTFPATMPPGVIRTLYHNAACEAIINHQMAIAASNGSAPFSIIYTRTDEASGVVRTTTALSVNGQARLANICGNFSTPSLPAYITRMNEGEEVIVPGIMPASRASITNHFVSMHQAVLDDTMNAMRGTAQRILPDMLDASLDIPDLSNDIQAAMINANSRLEAGSNEILSLAVGSDRQGAAARQALLNRIRGNCTDGTGEEEAMRCYGEGWIGAGSWYMMFAQLNNEMSSLFNAQPSAAEGSYVASPDPVNRNIHVASGGSRFGNNTSMIDPTGIQLAMDRYMEAFDRSTEGLAALGFPMSTMHLAQLSDTNPSSVFQRIPGMTEWVTRVRAALIGFFSPGNRFFADDPMIGMSTLGAYLLNGAGILLAAAAATGFFTGGGVAVMIMPLFVALITAGSILHMLLPIMPFIFWVLAVTGYFILIVEAMIAVNLWAIAHMRMDGDGISGEAGRNGWLMLLSLLMTPVLMVFGFLIGMTIFRVTSALLDIGIFQALAGILGGNIWITIIAIFSYSIFMAIFYMILLERSFSLVSEFPGRVLRWMGASAELTSGEENKVRMAAAGAGLAVAKGATAPSGVIVRAAGGAGLSRGGATGNNPNNDPGRWGASRRALENADGQSREGDGWASRAIRKPLIRGAQRITGTGGGIRSDDRGNSPPRSSG